MGHVLQSTAPKVAKREHLFSRRSPRLTGQQTDQRGLATFGAQSSIFKGGKTCE